MKKDPKYFLSVEVGDNAESNNKNLVFQLPLTCEFSISRTSLGSANTACFRMTNLGKRTQKLIYHDAFDGTRLRAVQFRAGYEDFQPLIFNGTILQAFSYRQGVDMITEIQCLDGGFQSVNGFISMSVGPGQTDTQLLNTLAKSLPYTNGNPIIGNFPNTNSRTRVLSGSAWGLITQISRGVATVDNGQVKILNNNEVIDSNGQVKDLSDPNANVGPIAVINSQSGLLGSPRRSGVLLEFDMIFEPRFAIGALVQLESTTNEIFNGVYKVAGFEHSGTISAAVDGERITTVSLYLGPQVINVIRGVVLQ